MWWLLVLVTLVGVVAVVALVTERRRRGLGGDAREDRFREPGRDRPRRWADKYGEHGGTGG